jgi:hypothetical protein
MIVNFDESPTTAVVKYHLLEAPVLMTRMSPPIVTLSRDMLRFAPRPGVLKTIL